MFNILRIFLTALCVLIISFVVVCGFVAIITLFFPGFLRFWPVAVSFSIGGVFAATLVMEYGLSFSTQKTEYEKWVLILFLILCGSISFFVLSTYVVQNWFEMKGLEIVFKAFGASLALGSLLFAFKKPPN